MSLSVPGQAQILDAAAASISYQDELKIFCREAVKLVSSWTLATLGSVAASPAESDDITDHGVISPNMNFPAARIASEGIERAAGTNSQERAKSIGPDPGKCMRPGSREAGTAI